MTVSVIVPLYNVEKYIEKCATSLFEQTLKENIEFIFVDDCCTDNSLNILTDIIAKYPQRSSSIKILHHNQNKGLAAARNTGYAAASGQYIIHCDSDDWVAPEMYECLLVKAEAEKADAVFCDYIGVYKHKQITFRQSTTNDPSAILSKLLDGTLHNGVWNKLIHRSLYEHLNMLWQDGVNMWEDVSIIPRLIYFAKKISYVNKPLYFYNQTNPSSYTRCKSSQLVKQIDTAFNIINDFFSSKTECKIADPLIKFKHRALYGILTRVPSGEERFWIDKYNPSKEFLLKNPYTGVHKLIYQLYLHKHRRAANTLLKIINHIKRMVR